MALSPITGLIHGWSKSRWQSRLLLCLSGALYPLAFSPFDLWPLAFISLIPLLWALTGQCILKPFQIGFYWGLGANLFGTSWVYVSIHEFGFVPAPGAAALTLLFVLFLATFKGLFAYCCSRLLALSQPSLLILIAPLCWLLGEFLQASLFGGFPWLIAGYSQIDAPLAPLATWFGVYGISWMIVALSASAVLLLGSWQNKAVWASIMLALSIVVLASVDAQHSQPRTFATRSIDIALVQPNVAQEKKWDRRYFSSIVNILFEESKDHWGADLLVWPEGAIPAYAHQVNDILHDLEKLGRQNDTQILVGIPEYEADTEKSYVSLLALGKENQRYHKQVLVPFGEYVPLEAWLRGLIQFLDLPMSGFTPGEAEQPPLGLVKATVIPAICYEIVYPEIIRKLSVKAPESKPQLIVTVSNDAWFGDSFGPYQHMQMARMRSLELGVPLIRATNDGITAVVDIDGQTLKRLPRYQQGSLRYQLSLENRHTRFRSYGAWGILLLCVLSGGVVAWSILRQPV